MNPLDELPWASEEDEARHNFDIVVLGNAYVRVKDGKKHHVGGEKICLERKRRE